MYGFEQPDMSKFWLTFVTQADVRHDSTSSMGQPKRQASQLPVEELDRNSSKQARCLDKLFMEQINKIRLNLKILNHNAMYSQTQSIFAWLTNVDAHRCKIALAAAIARNR